MSHLVTYALANSVIYAFLLVVTCLIFLIHSWPWILIESLAAVRTAACGRMPRLALSDSVVDREQGISSLHLFLTTDCSTPRSIVQFARCRVGGGDLEGTARSSGLVRWQLT